MAKGAYLTPRIRELITRIYLENRQIRPTEAHKLLLGKMKAEGLHEIFGPSFPSISTVSKELKSLRERDEARSPESQGLDEPWTIGSLSKYPILPEALPKVFQIWLFNQELPYYPPLTVREARWIAQLSGMTEEIEDLRIWAEMCAEWELIGELTNSPQLSSPVTIFHIYAGLIKMEEKEEKEHYEAILKEKHPSVSGTRREKTMKGLEAMYGKSVLRTVKPKSKNKKGGTK